MVVNKTNKNHYYYYYTTSEWASIAAPLCQYVKPHDEVEFSLPTLSCLPTCTKNSPALLSSLLLLLPVLVFSLETLIRIIYSNYYNIDAFE